MLYTLLELARIYNFPFIVEHRYSTKRYVVLGYAGDSGVLFEVKLLERGEDSPALDEETSHVYGGYEMWRFEKKMDGKKTITPEEQKKLREEQRRIDNEKTKRAYRLKAGDSVRSKSVTKPAKIEKKIEEGNIIRIDFKKKDKF